MLPVGTLRGKALRASRVDTNYLLQSETLNLAPWAATGLTVGPDVTTAPNGTVTAEKFNEDTSTGIHRVTQTVTCPLATYCLSAYIKAAERTKCIFGYSDNVTGGSNYVFDLATGTFSMGPLAFGTWTNSYALIAMLGDGWYRCSITATRKSGIQTVAVIYNANAAGSQSYAGVLNNGLYIWGAQLEIATRPSAYIPTTTAQVSKRR